MRGGRVTPASDVNDDAPLHFHFDAYGEWNFTKKEADILVQAIEEFDRGLELQPEDSLAYFQRGSTKGRMGMHEAATFDFDGAVGLDTSLKEAHSTRGISKMLLGEVE